MKRFKTIAGRVALCALLASAALAPAVRPSVAQAQTIGELDEQIASIEATLGARERAVEEAQRALSENIRASYKSNSDGGLLSILFDSDGLEAMMSNEQYASSINRKHMRAIAAARHAVDELNGAKETLRRLRDERADREEARRKADTYHYCQWGQYYSDLRYYCGTIGSAGCGLCSYTSAINILKGTDYWPDTMLAERGDWAGTEQSVNAYVGSPNGMTHAEWTKDRFDVEMETVASGTGVARELLGDGESVLIVCSHGTVFHDKAGVWRWSSGHYVIIYRCDDGGFYVHDSSYQGDNGTAVYYTDAEMANMMGQTGEMVWMHN